MAGNLFNFPRAIAFDVGVVQPGAKITFTATGTTDPQNTYTNIDLTVASSNPVVADAEGLFVPIYLDPTLPDYRVKYTDSADVLIYQEDDVPASQSGQSLTLTDTAPFIDLIETDAAANNTSWRIQVNSEQFTLQVANDALAAFTDILTIDRTANTVDTIDLLPTTLQHNAVNIATATDITTVQDQLDERDAEEKIKAGSTIKTSDASLADDPELSGWALTTGKIYSIQAYLDLSQNGGDLKFTFQFSNAPQQTSMLIYSQDESGTIFEDLSLDITATDTITTMTDTERYGLTFTGQFSANASTGGTVDFQWAQNGSDSNATTLFFGSWIMIRQLN